jgi:hypothetical protein
VEKRPRCWNLCFQPKTQNALNPAPMQNILGHFSVEQQKAIRSRIIQLVLVTDMSEHFEFAGRVSDTLSSVNTLVWLQVEFVR